jgi:hypothetical protein
MPALWRQYQHANGYSSAIAGKVKAVYDGVLGVQAPRPNGAADHYWSLAPKGRFRDKVGLGPEGEGQFLKSLGISGLSLSEPVKLYGYLFSVVEQVESLGARQERLIDRIGDRPRNAKQQAGLAKKYEILGCRIDAYLQARAALKTAQGWAAKMLLLENVEVLAAEGIMTDSVRELQGRLDRAQHLLEAQRTTVTSRFARFGAALQTYT